jgi:hypothetical protein
MSSTSADGGEAQTRNCPDCGTELEFDIITEHGTEEETTMYEGLWCSTCRRGMVACSGCNGLHHPDRICEPKREARLEAAKEMYGDKAKVPGHGIIPVEELETIGEGTLVFIDEDGCPKSDCDGDLVFEMVEVADFANIHHPKPKYQPMCDYCTEFDNGNCTHRRP